MHWVNPTTHRWYAASVVRDLLGDTVIVLRWGSRVTRRGGLRSQAVSGEGQAERLILQLRRRRTRRGYQEVSGAVPLTLPTTSNFHR